MVYVMFFRGSERGTVENRVSPRGFVYELGINDVWCNEFRNIAGLTNGKFEEVMAICSSWHRTG